MKAAKAGNITTLKELIQEKKIDVDTHGTWKDPWVS